MADYSATELMICVSARLLENGSTVGVGTGAPCAAAMLAQRTHAPNLFIVFEAGGLAPLRTDPGHLGAAPPRQAHRIVESPATRIRGDGNTVDIDREMTSLAVLQGRYTAATQMVKTRFALLEYAVTSGGHR